MKKLNKIEKLDLMKEQMRRIEKQKEAAQIQIKAQTMEREQNNFNHNAQINNQLRKQIRTFVKAPQLTPKAPVIGKKRVSVQAINDE